MTDSLPEEAPDHQGELEHAEEEAAVIDDTVAPEETHEVLAPEDAQPESEFAEPVGEEVEVPAEPGAEEVVAAPLEYHDNGGLPEEVNSGKRKLEEYEFEVSDQPDAKRMNEINGAMHQVESVNISAGDLPEDAPDASGQMVGYVSCPEALVSKLIGKKGSVIQYLETTTGAKIQVEHQKAGDPKHVRIIAKSQEDLEKTRQTIKNTLESDQPLGEVTKVVPCPHSMVGRIIGRSGQTILSLQQASQAKIIVDQDAERFPDGVPRDVRIIGPAHCVERAEKMVVELMNADPGVSAQSVIQKYGLGSSKTMSCPRGMVGRVIGKQGETIKQLQRTTGANIQIDQAADPCVITVTGPSQAINTAINDIRHIINDTGMGGYGGMNKSGMPGGYGSPYGAPYGNPGGPYAGSWNYQAQPYGPPYQGYPSSYGQPQAYPGYSQDSYSSYGPSSAYAMNYSQPTGLTAHSWSEEFDAASQRPYYYNATTGKTQWEKPAEMM